MLPSSAHKSNQGFTLPEVLIIVVVVGILAAIAVPSFLGWYNRQKVNQALTQVQGALKETQREAIKRSKSCTVTLNTNTVTGPCLVTGRRDLCEKRDSSDACIKPGVELTVKSPNTLSNGNQIQYSFRGNTTNGGIIILALPDNSSYQKCLVTSVGIGLVRTGSYKNEACST